jgi:hypothetical protein
MMTTGNAPLTAARQSRNGWCPRPAGSPVLFSRHRCWRRTAAHCHSLMARRRGLLAGDICDSNCRASAAPSKLIGCPSRAVVRPTRPSRPRIAIARRARGRTRSSRPCRPRAWKNIDPSWAALRGDLRNQKGTPAEPVRYCRPHCSHRTEPSAFAAGPCGTGNRTRPKSVRRQSSALFYTHAAGGGARGER